MTKPTLPHAQPEQGAPGQWEGPGRSQPAPAHFIAAPPGGLHALASWHLKIMSYFTCDSLSVVGSPCPEQPPPGTDARTIFRAAPGGYIQWQLPGLSLGTLRCVGVPREETPSCGDSLGNGAAQSQQGFTLRTPSWPCATQDPRTPRKAHVLGCRVGAWLRVLPEGESTALEDSARVAGLWPHRGWDRQTCWGSWAGGLFVPMTAQASLTLWGARQGGIARLGI